MSVSLPGAQIKLAWEEMALYKSDSVQDEKAALEGHTRIFWAYLQIEAPAPLALQ